MNKIEKFLKVQVDYNVIKTMKKEKVPRSKIIEEEIQKFIENMAGKRNK